MPCSEVADLDYAARKAYEGQKIPVRLQFRLTGTFDKTTLPAGQAELVQTTYVKNKKGGLSLTNRENRR
jgi:hypothetical protein